MSEIKTIRVRDIMKTKFDMVDGISTVEDAINQMSHVETKCLVVRKRNENDEYGLVMLSDIAREVLAKDKSPSRTNIYEIMSKPVITVDPDMDIRYCARLFERFQIGLPVFWSIHADGASVPAWPLEARLKYRVQQGAVIFYYQLIRPDIVHEAAALALIDQVRAGLGDVPVRMGSCA